MNHSRNTTLILAAGLALSSTATAQISSYIGTDPIGHWDDINNWNNGVPNEHDENAFVGPAVAAENAALWLDQNVLVNGLLITDGMMVATQGHHLSIGSFVHQSDCIVAGFNMIGDTMRRSRLRVREGNGANIDLLSANVSLQSGGALELANGAYFYTIDPMDIDAQSVLEGDGEARINNDLDNNGMLRAAAGGTLLVHHDDNFGGALDLDGWDETGVLSAEYSNSQLILRGERSDTFDGQILVGPGSRVFFDNAGENGPVGLGINGDTFVTLNGQQDEPAILEVGTHFSSNHLSLDVTGHGRLAGGFICIEGTEIEVAPDSLLELSDGPVGFAGGTLIARENAVLDVQGTFTGSTATNVILDGGTITGAGTFTNNDNQGVFGHGLFDMELNNQTFVSASDGTLIIDGLDKNNDWDGADDAGQLIAMYGDLHVKDDEYFQYHGDVVVGNGNTLFIEGFNLHQWTDSTVQLIGGTIDGEMRQAFSGTMQVFDTSYLNMSAYLNGAPTVELGADLHFNGASNLISGASQIGGPGTIVIGSDAVFNAGNGIVIDADFHNEGMVRTSIVIGTVIVNRDFDHFGTLQMQLGGATIGSYDHLTVGQALTVRNGIFNIHLHDGFRPKIGDEFNLLDFAEFVDMGYTLNLPSLGKFLAWDTSDFESLGVIRVTPALGWQDPIRKDLR